MAKRMKAGTLALLGAGAGLLAVAVGVRLASPGFHSSSLVVPVVGFTLVMLIAFAIGAVWMTRIDEAARMAHLSAWYWGGSAGLVVGGVGILIAYLEPARRWVPPALFHGRTDPAILMAEGALILMLLMTVGYTMVWAWWWARRR